MDNDSRQRDSEIRAAIDEYHEAGEQASRIYKETEQWQKENPPPTKPSSVQSMSEVEEFERKNEERSKPYQERLAQRHEADQRLREAQKRLQSVLPQDVGYEYKGKRYEYSLGSLRIDELS